MMKFSKILPVAALGIALSVSGAQKAEAYAYAYSDLFITKGAVTINNGGFVSLAPSSTSTATAALGGTGTATNAAGTNADTAVATGTGSSWNIGAPTNNSWALQGSSASNKYAWADSQIISEQSATSLISTRQIAEGNTTDSTLASSNADTSSITEVTFAVGAGGGTFQFDFDAQLNMLAEIVAPHTGIQALATAAIEISIRNTVGGALVFNWLAGAQGLGFNVASDIDGFSFANVSVATQNSLSSLNATDSFQVISTLLGQGVYEMSLKASVSERVQAHAIPAPGSIALLGLGLIALSFARKEKSATKLAA